MTLPAAVLVAAIRPRFVLLAVVLLGSGMRSLHETSPAYIHDDGYPARLTATVESAPELRGPGYDFTVRVVSVNDRPWTGRAQLGYFPPDDDHGAAGLFEELELGSGDRIEVLARLRRPTVYRNPGGFDYRAFLARRGIFWTGSIRSPRLIRVLERGWHGPDRMRGWATRRIARRIDASETVQALALGMVLGQRRQLPDDAERRFEAVGLIHLLVVSGFNLALVAGAALWVGRRLPFGATERASRLLFALGIVLVYAFLVDGEAPVARATMMAAFLIGGALLDRGYHIANSLSATALVLLAADPTIIEESGFQLTFAAVLAILFLAAPVIEWSTAPRRRVLARLGEPAMDSRLPTAAIDWRVSRRLECELSGRPLWSVTLPRLAALLLVDAAIVTLTVQTALVPWSVESYHRLSAVALPLNVVGAVIAAIVTPLGLLLIVLPELLAGAMAAVVELSLQILVLTVDLAVRLPGATTRVPSPPGLVWAAYFTALVCGSWFASRRLRTGLIGACCGIAVLIAVVAFADFAPEPPEQAVVTFLDVGQGDAALIELPDGRRIMVDGGGVGAYRSPTDDGGFSIGEDVLTPYLFSRRIRHLDALVLTHAHHDHMDGLFDLLANFTVDELWIGQNPMVPRYRDLLEEASRRAVPVRWLRTGDRIGPLLVLNPPAGGTTGASVRNDDSLVILLEAEYGHVLLTGDLERDLPGAPDHVTVLKVPHHGSGGARLRTTTDLPVISVGANNSFGHPHPDKLPALRTDILGAIEIRLTPGRPEVRFPGLEQPRSPR